MSVAQSNSCVGKPNQISEIEKRKIELLKIWSGYQFSRALHVAAELGIADLLHSGKKSVTKLAALTKTHENSLYRLLRALSSRGIFSENSDGTYSQTDLSELLRTDTPDSICDTVRMTDIAWWEAFGNLDLSIKTGQPAFSKITDCDYFSYHSANPEVSRQFENGMANYASMMNPKLVQSYDFSNCQTVVDIGGGKGAFLTEVLQQNEHVRGVLYDRPDVVENHSYITDAGLEERCDFVGGNFFKSVSAGGDTYILQHILHDWNDEDCIEIIKNIREVIDGNGRLLVIDAVLPPGNKAHPGKITDLLMMVLLEGKERTEEEFSELLKTASFEITSVFSTPTTLSIIEAKPV